MQLRRKKPKCRIIKKVFASIFFISMIDRFFSFHSVLDGKNKDDLDLDAPSSADLIREKVREREKGSKRVRERVSFFSDREAVSRQTETTTHAGIRKFHDEFIFFRV